MQNALRPSRSLVIPVYRNEGSVPDLLEAVRGLAKASHPAEFEAIFVVDGSPDRSYELLGASLPGAGFPSRLILLSRNFGSFLAIRAGLAAAKGSNVAVMAADLQEPPELMLEIFERLERGTCDVAVGHRVHRNDPGISRAFSTLFWSIYRHAIEPGMPRGGVDVFGCTSVFKDTLLKMDEAHSSLVGLIFWMGFRRETVPYSRARRRHGRSAWSFRRKLKYVSDSIFSFTDLPIRLVLISGAIGVSTSIVFGIIALIGRISGWITVPGYTAIVLIILFFGALMQLGLGIVGSYVWRTFENTKRRPSFIVMREETFASNPTPSR